MSEPRPTRRKTLVRWGLRLGLAVATVGVLALLVSAFLPWADLRTPAVRERGGQEEAQARGRALLEAAARRHGLEAWRARRTMEVVAVDRWTGSSAWWPEPAQRFRARRLLGSFTSQVELLGGPLDGEVWGIQSWSPYKIGGDGEVHFLETDDAIEFYLPTLHYFDELPFRLLRAELVTDAGPAELGGRTYDRVFVTWGNLEPHAEHDAYVVWIGRESGLVEKVAYTVRDAVPLAPPWMRGLARLLGVGTMHYDDFHTVDGVVLPFLQTVTLFGPERATEPVSDNYFHQLVVEEVRFDSFDPSLLVVDPRLPESGDRKPAKD